MNLADSAAALRARRVSCRELAQDALRKIAELNGRLNAFLTVTEERALRQAEALDRELAAGRDRGRLHGIPYALKDNLWTKGIRTTNGSKIWQDHVPGESSAAFERMESAGAVLVGKTNLHEIAYGVTSSNPHFGVVRNPHDVDRIPGGSSGGSGAAVAAGIVPLAMGSDTGGSIRIPASYCGTVGLKATYGRVSRYGAVPLGLSLDHVGPLTATVRDAAIALEALAGYDARDNATSHRPVERYEPDDAAVKGIRIGVPENFYFEYTQDEVRHSVEGALGAAETAGVRLTPVRVPDIEALNTISRVVLLAEASALYEPYLDRRELFGPDVLALLDQGRFLPATDYVNAQRARRLAQDEFRALFCEVDLLATPTLPITAPRIGEKKVTIQGREEDVRLATTRFVRAINLIGLPAISLPCGKDSTGLPIGLQLIARPFEETLLLRVAHAVEMALS